MACTAWPNAQITAKMRQHLVNIENAICCAKPDVPGSTLWLLRAQYCEVAGLFGTEPGGMTLVQSRQQEEDGG